MDKSEEELENLIFNSPPHITNDDELPSTESSKPIRKNTKRKKKTSSDRVDDDPDGEEEALTKAVITNSDSFTATLSTIHKRKQKKRQQLSVKPVWEDNDDLVINNNCSLKESTFRKKSLNEVVAQDYKNKLKENFENVNGIQNWAKLPWQKDYSDSEEEMDILLQRTGNYLTKPTSLPKTHIDLKSCGNANNSAKSKGFVHSVEFHPAAQVLLTGGSDKTLRLFQIDGKTNPLIQSVFFEQFPIKTAHFTSDGREVILGSVHSSFHFYDMIEGKIGKVPKIKGLGTKSMSKFHVSPDGNFLVFIGDEGKLHLFSAKTKEWIQDYKMNGSAEAVAFTKDGSSMYSIGGEGEVYIWDMNRRSCTHRFTDDGCLQGMSIDVSPDGRYLATGCSSGVVNIHKLDSISEHRTAKPMTSFMNLTTCCTAIKFNHSSELLCLTSDQMDRAVKLVHVPSMSIFKNFPQLDAKLKKPTTVDFSLNSGYFCFGQNAGTAPLFRIEHYKDF